MKKSDSLSTTAAHVSETRFVVADGSCWQHCISAFITHRRLQFPLSELPTQLQHITPKMIASPKGPCMQLTPEAVVFLRNEMTSFLNGCEGVVIEEGKWGTLPIAAGVLSLPMGAPDRTLSLTDSPGGGVQDESLYLNILSGLPSSREKHYM